MPTYTRGGESGVSRTVPAWQAAQFRNTRSSPRFRRIDMPTKRPARLVDHPERGVAVAGQVLGADLGQHLPDPERKTRGPLTAGGPVLEMLLDIVVGHRQIGQETRADRHAQRQRDHQNRRQDGKSAPPARSSAIGFVVTVVFMLCQDGLPAFSRLVTTAYRFCMRRALRRARRAARPAGQAAPHTRASAQVPRAAAGQRLRR